MKRGSTGLSGIRARTCADHFAGTSDNVKVHLRNADHETCSTNWLEDGGLYRGRWAQRWPADHLKTWTSETQLGSCGATAFRSVGRLEFRLEFRPHLWNLHFNRLRLCQFEADFGPTRLQRKVKEWSRGRYTTWIAATETEITGEKFLLKDVGNCVNYGGNKHNSSHGTI